MTLRILLLAPLILLLCGPARAGDLTLKTKDGVRIAATFREGPSRDCPAVVCLPMYGAKRASYAPLVEDFRSRGLALLAIDLRGHGDSRRQRGEDWMRRVLARDATLFNAMHFDAIAAVRWLVKHGHSRVGLLGASVGCSVALDTAHRYPKEIASVACLTPGSRYLGVDSLAHAMAIPDTLPVLLVSHATEVANGTAALEKILKSCRVRILRTTFPVPGKARRGYFHGTRMFKRVPLIEPYLASWFARTLKSMPGEALLDGDPVADAATWAKATELHDGAHAYRVGRRLVLSGRLPKGVRLLRVKVRIQARRTPRAKTAGPPALPAGLCGSLFSTLIEAPQGRERELLQSWGGAHLRIAFTMHQGRHGFEAELMLPESAGESGWQVEADWGWLDKLPQGAPPIPTGPPGTAPGDWVEIPSR